MAGCCARRRGILFIPCSLRPEPRRTTSAGGGDSRFSGNDGARAVGRRAASAGTGSRRRQAGCCARRRGYSLSLARSDLRRAERHLLAAAIPVLAEMMELGRWGDERHRQVRGLADRWPGVAHGGGGYSLSLARSDLSRAERSETRRLLGKRSQDLSAKSNSKRT